MKGDILITNNIILWDTKYGKVNCHLKDIMKKNNITIYQLVRLTNLRYEIISRYYADKVKRYDGVVLAKLCYSLKCSISDLLEFSSN